MFASLLDCYNLVDDKVEGLREKIKQVEKNLNEMLSTFNATMSQQEYEEKEENIELIEKLKSLKLLVEDLHIKLFAKRKLKPGYKESVVYLQGEVKKLADSVKNTDQQFDQFNGVYRQVEKFFKQLNSSIYLAQTQLNFISLKNQEKKQQLESIKNDRINHDHNIRLQVLAKQAREAANQHSEIASNAITKYQKYMNDARNALAQLKEVIAQQALLKEENEANLLSFNYEKIRTSSSSLIKEALAQKQTLDRQGQEAKELIKKLKNFKIPQENQSDSWISKNKKAYEGIKKKYFSMRKEIDDLKAKFDKFSNVDSLRSIGSAQTELNNVRIKQKDIDSLFKIAEKTKNQSNEANQLAKEIFENATKIFDTLKRFDQLILEGTEKVRKSLELKPKIEVNLAESEKFSNKIAKQLKTLNEQLETVKKASSKSTFILQNVNTTLASLQSKYDDLKNLISKLSERTKEINKSFSGATLSKSSEAAEIFSNLNSRCDKIQKQAEQVTNGTQKLLDNANNALENLNRVNKSISDLSVSNLKRDDIEKLQKKFDLLTKQIEKNFAMDDAILNLEKKTKLSLNIVLQYDYEVNYLKQQVNELDALNRTLKRECYNTNTIVIPEL